MKVFRLVLLIWASCLITCHASIWGRAADSSGDIPARDGDSETVSSPPAYTEADDGVNGANPDDAAAALAGDDEMDDDVIFSSLQETEHSPEKAGTGAGAEEDGECDKVNESEPDPAAEDAESAVDRYTSEAVADDDDDLGEYQIDDYGAKDIGDFNMSNMTFGSLNTSLYADLNLTLSTYALNFSLNDTFLSDTFLNGTFGPWNMSLSALLDNYSSILKLKEASFHRLHPNGSQRKANKTSLWQCYNGSGVTYGAVKLLDLSQLTLFLHRLACCERAACPTVAEQQRLLWWRNGSGSGSGNGSDVAGCSASRLLAFRRLVLSGGRCVAPGGEWLATANASSRAAPKTPTMAPFSMNLLWAGGPELRGGATLLQNAAAELAASVGVQKRNASGGGGGGGGGASGNSSGNGTAPPAAAATTTQRCQCAVLMIYAPTCPYSVKLAPLYSTLARRFPPLPFLAIDAESNSSIHYIFGVVGLPTVILLHKHKERYFARSFADWQDLELMTSFVTKFTGLKPLANVTVNASDYNTGLPVTVRAETDYLLIFSTLYVVLGAWFLVVR